MGLGLAPHKQRWFKEYLKKQTSESKYIKNKMFFHPLFLIFIIFYLVCCVHNAEFDQGWKLGSRLVNN